MIAERVLTLDGVHNFRDYGGYPTAGGGRIKSGWLWRSGQHAGASDADLDQIADVGFAAVFDLRSGSERKHHPCRRPAGFDAELFTLDEASAGLAPHVQAAQDRTRDPESMRQSMVQAYSGFPFRTQLNELIGRYLRTLPELSGPSLINCMAGKDRTGFAVAMLHSALGVHRDDIMADFLLTNTAGDSEARIAAAVPVLAATRIGAMDEDVLRVLMNVEPEYLETAFAAIDETFGSVDAFLEKEYRVGAEQRERLREALVEA